MARNFAEYVPYATVSHRPDPESCNVYFPYYLYQPTARDICLFTHREDEKQDVNAAMKAGWFDKTAEAADHCWAMSEHTAKFLPPEKTTVIKPPPDPVFMGRRLVLGFSGIPQPFGRKNFEWIDELQKIPGVMCRWTMGKLEQKAMPDFYHGIDYLVIVSNNEGGPMPVVEALACGTPVIAPNVGWAWDYPVLHYEDFYDLTRIIEGMLFPLSQWTTAGQSLYNLCIGDQENG
jgi:hypothetical protein